MTLRRHLLDLLSEAPRSVFSIAREMGLRRADAEEDLGTRCAPLSPRGIASKCFQRDARTVVSCLTRID
jgi:hypothetical protein